MVLSNTALANLIVTIDGTIVLIAVPSIFRGIHLDPLAAENTRYMLWLILGFMIVMAVLVVSLGRLGDIYGRVRVYKLSFVVFTVFSILLAISWMQGAAGIATFLFRASRLSIEGPTAVAVPRMDTWWALPGGGS